ncbi:Alpha/beta hydrolase fold [Thermoanaerobacterium thermosaccharolyticum]|uniref:Alpha/beta hydrolase fold n=2 Tax=Thermoanaerobacterium thermosaccharolyticum TaxID=1517 RepID=D9TTR0_THETC|nr:alpha/beta hydrolase [Thermoanaerobacterium thermosaccharolyticum]ADL69950.1 alpha/beta hydrolase fold [Thermoanaerobacterium thermosaccharolyticum DSM 571]AST57166.1 Alpha/beta hydrolase fold [Thermoanaerobacterium thermosaccharolyticum]
MTADNKYVNIDGAMVHYLTSGHGDKGDVLLLHGKRFTIDDWVKYGIVDNIAEEGYRVIAVELPGYGKSEILDISYEDFLMKFVSILNINKVNIVGPSFSGEILIRFALKYQEMIRSLIIVDSINIDKYVDRLKEIKVNTLIIWGKKDDIAPYEFATMLKQNIQNAKLYTFDDLGHTCYFDKPDVFTDELIKFLNQD